MNPLNLQNSNMHMRGSITKRLCFQYTTVHHYNLKQNCAFRSEISSKMKIIIYLSEVRKTLLINKIEFLM